MSYTKSEWSVTKVEKTGTRLPKVKKIRASYQYDIFSFQPILCLEFQFQTKNKKYTEHYLTSCNSAPGFLT